jgi:hemerythrin superfamily protein
MAESTTPDVSATELLREQHDNVKQMLSQFGPSKGNERRELFDCLRAALAVHETAEEMVVHPALRSVSDEGRRIADARIEEEKQAKRVLADLEKLGVDGSGFDALFEEFRTSVLQHAEAEESQAFPMLEAGVPADKLRQMAKAIRTAEKLAPTHPHPHGPSGAIGTTLVGPVVGLVDKVRDALSDRTEKSERKTG